MPLEPARAIDRRAHLLAPPSLVSWLSDLFGASGEARPVQPRAGRRFRLGARNVHALRPQQTELPVPTETQRVDMKVAGRICSIHNGGHNGGWRRYDPQWTTLPDPVDVTMSMHDHDLAAEALELPHEPRAIDECGTNPLREKLGRIGILYEMVM